MPRSLPPSPIPRHLENYTLTDPPARLKVCIGGIRIINCTYGESKSIFADRMAVVLKHLISSIQIPFRLVTRRTIL
ncbi:hypothetical protein PENTCL1PPCAC_8395, partial [Pristionchus entomophagus]